MAKIKHTDVQSQRIKELIIRLGDPNYHPRAHTTPQQQRLLERELEVYIEEYNLQAEQVAEERPYQWTIEAYLHCRCGDEYVGNWIDLLQTGNYNIAPTDTIERLTSKPTVWQYNSEQSRLKLKEKHRKALKKQQTQSQKNP